MGNFPSAAATLQPQPNVVQQYATLQDLLQRRQMGQEQLRGAQLANQNQGLENQQRQMALQDQQAQTAAMHEWDGKDLNDLPALILKHGGSANAVFGNKQQILKYQTDLEAMNKDKLANEKVRNDYFAQQLDNVKSLPPEEQPAAFEQAKADAIKQSHLDPNIAQGLSYQGPQQLDMLEKTYMGRSGAIEAALKTAETSQKANQATLEGNQAALEGIKLKLVQGAKPGDFDTQIDSIAPPQGSSASLNHRTKTMVNFALQRGDVEGATKAIDSASAELGTIEKETNPSVMAARTQQSVATQRALTTGSNAAVANVPPHLVSTAITDYNKVGDEYASAASAANDMKTFISLARQGNKVAYAYSPVEGVLTLNTGRGIKRVNMPEIQSYGGAGSAYDRIVGFLGKQATGASIPDSVLNDMEQLHGALADNAKDLYSRKIDVLNRSYGSNFQPVDFAKAAPQSRSGGQITVTDPSGGVHTFADQASADKFKKLAGIR